MKNKLQSPAIVLQKQLSVNKRTGPVYVSAINHNAWYQGPPGERWERIRTLGLRALHLTSFFDHLSVGVALLGDWNLQNLSLVYETLAFNI
jgi:hypothetical protein